jgi:hypothetical protein
MAKENYIHIPFLTEAMSDWCHEVLGIRYEDKTSYRFEYDPTHQGHKVKCRFDKEEDLALFILRWK